MQDNLLKFNYFLTDVRGRSVRAYLKIPPPSIDDPTREQFVTNMLKHGINIDEYCLLYEKCSIPSNNNLSKLAMDVFARSACLINQYSKYRNALNSVIQVHATNSAIRETNMGTFIILNEDAFTLQFHDIENLVTGSYRQQTENPFQLATVMDRASEITVQQPRTTSIEVDGYPGVVEENVVAQHHRCAEGANNDQNVDMTRMDRYLRFIFNHLFFSIEAPLSEQNISSENDFNSSAVVQKSRQRKMLDVY